MILPSVTLPVDIYSFRRDAAFLDLAAFAFPAFPFFASFAIETRADLNISFYIISDPILPKRNEN